MMQLMLLDVVTEYLAALDTLDLDVYDPDAIGVVDEAEQRLWRWRFVLLAIEL